MAGKGQNTRKIPTREEARDYLKLFRDAPTEREKRVVINGIRQRYPDVADRFTKLLRTTFGMLKTGDPNYMSKEAECDEPVRKTFGSKVKASPQRVPNRHRV
jgi:hypothetical protein